MNAAPLAGSLESMLADYHSSALADLRLGSARWAIVAVVGLTFGLLLLATTVYTPIEPRAFSVIAGLGLVAALAYLALRLHVLGASGVLVSGLLATLVAATAVWPGAVTAPWAALVVLAAVVLLGWQLGVVAALVVTGLLATMTQQAGGFVTADVAISAASLSWAILLFYSLSSWPTHTVLDWALSSYLQALEQTREARKRQAELARLSKGLSETNYQLEQLNLELERARRSAQKAHELKAQFAASVSHELRTPLNLIIGFCEMMVLSPDSAYGQRLPASYRGDLEAIYRNACHISTLIDDILDLSQIDADRMALQREWASLRLIVEEAMATVETLFRDRELTLVATITPDLPALFVDRTRIRQILINLLANAARFTEQGGVTIGAAQQGAYVVVSVSDTGPGIPVDEQSHVFDEFRQICGKKWQRGGSGLGLAISKRFAELHGGTMWVESVVGQGSTFYLKLPVIADEQTSVVGGREDWGDRIGRRVRGQADRRVLVVGESGQVHKVFQRYLDGYQVLDASDLAEDRERRKAAPVHAVILGTPEAWADWRKLQRRMPDLQQVPVVYCALHTVRSTAGEMGVVDYLVKPVTRSQLRAAFARLERPVNSALVVDDDAEINRLLARMVRSLRPSCQILTAEDGGQALELLREVRPDVVLLDLLMPSIDGYAVLETMRSDPHLRTVPVLVVTARGLQDETTVASTLSLSREGGLTVAEVMRWLTGGLEALLQLGNSAPAPPSDPAA